LITQSLDLALKALKNDEIIAIPTETVYGLAGNAYSPEAVQKIFDLKKRPFYNPLIVHIKSIEFLSEVALEVPDTARILAKAFWPGPLTLILKKQSKIPDLVTAGKGTLAVRVPNHPITLALLESLDFPLAAPSANPFGSISPTSAEHVFDYFKKDLPYILDGGNCEKGLESTIIGFDKEKPVLYRLGAISVEELENKVGKIQIPDRTNNNNPDAPGMGSKHYSPSTKMYLTENMESQIILFENKKIGLLLFKECIEGINLEYQEVLSPKGDLEEAAQNLYSAMHRLDQMNLDILLAEKLPDYGLGRTINDRLIRAVAK